MARPLVRTTASVFALLACGDGPVRAPPPEPLPVAVDGCDHLLPGPRCLQRSPHAMRLWLAGDWPLERLSLRFDETRIEAPVLVESADVLGTLLEFQPPKPEGVVVLGHDDGRRFELAVEPAPAAYVRAYARVYERAQTSINEARAELARQGQALGDELDRHLLGQVDLVLAHAAGEFADVDALTRHLDGVPAGSFDAHGIGIAHAIAAHVALQNRLDYANAQLHIDALSEEKFSVDLEAQIARARYASALTSRVSRLGEALSSLQHFVLLAERFGNRDYHAAALVDEAMVLAELARFAEAETLMLEAAARVGEDSAYRDEIRHNEAWIRILRREYEPDALDPTPILDDLVRRGARSEYAESLQLDLAIVSIQNEAYERAKSILDALVGATLNNLERVFVELLRGRIAHHASETVKARGHLERAALLADLVGDQVLSLRVHVERARFERQAGNPGAARTEFEHAERIEDQLALGIAPQLGRSTFSHGRRHARAEFIELLLDRGDRSAALCTVLAARARHQRSLSVRHDRVGTDHGASIERRQLWVRHRTLRDELERRAAENWKYPLDELKQRRQTAATDIARLEALAVEAVALVERERNLERWVCTDVRSTGDAHAVLTMHPTSKRGSWWFMLDRQGVTIEVMEHSVENVRDGATRVLGQIVDVLARDGHLEGLARLTVVPLGPFGSVDVHELAPIRERNIHVAYSLGLGYDPKAVETDGSAVVLAGGGDDLRESLTEAVDVRASLARRGWTVRDAWSPGDERQPRLLHYAGHGHRAGPVGWDSELMLADGPLTTEEIVAHAHAPSIVVLDACEAAATDDSVLDGGMNIAAAFLMAGAELVIAPRTAVNDRDAHALARALYRDLSHPNASSEFASELVATLTTIQREGRSPGQESRAKTFSSWRAWVP